MAESDVRKLGGLTCSTLIGCFVQLAECAILIGCLLVQLAGGSAWVRVTAQGERRALTLILTDLSNLD